MQDMGKKQGSQSSNKQNQENTGSQPEQQQEIPLSTRAQKLSQQMDEKIDQFEQVLRSRSNSEIKQVSEQLDRV
jgi:2-methylcitrate dehydratase PrpD